MHLSISKNQRERTEYIYSVVVLIELHMSGTTKHLFVYISKEAAGFYIHQGRSHCPRFQISEVIQQGAWGNVLFVLLLLLLLLFLHLQECMQMHA